MEKYLVFLIAWFGNKFIKHIKIPQGLQLCSVSKQSHLPWPYSCRIKRIASLFSPGNTILTIYVALQILKALEQGTKSRCHPNRAVDSSTFNIPHKMLLSCLPEERTCPVGSCLPGSEIVSSTPAGFIETQAHPPKPAWFTQIGHNEGTVLIVFKIVLKTDKQK